VAEARSHRRKPVKRDIRAAKKANARDAIGTLTPGCEIFCLTFGQFSLIDALSHLVEQVGPADVTLSTWVAAKTDLSIAARLLESCKIRDMRLLVDSNFKGRQARFLGTMRELFGDDCVRSTRNHAKFMTLRNDDWHVTVRTSMNLNENPRLENIEISDDPELCAFLVGIVDEIFLEQQPGIFDGLLPDLAAVDDVPRTGAVPMGRAIAAGRPATGPHSP